MIPDNVLTTHKPRHKSKISSSRRPWFWTKIAIIIYCTIGFVLYYTQEYFLFHPDVIARDVPYTFSVPFEEKAIPFSSTDTISMVKFFTATKPSKGIVLYFHGNKGNINRYAKFAQNFTSNGYEIWMLDYPGFGKSVGKRSEAKIYSQAEQVYKLAKSVVSPDSIVVYGKSIGTGVAAYIASRNDCKQLILETPYSSIPDLFACYAPIYPTERMATYRFPIIEYLRDVKSPITIFHGTKDKVIPYRCAARLIQSLKKGDDFVTIESGAHHNLNDYPKFQEKLKRLLR
jgi:alpha-beta hydrolase superfamily lysophospholipase